MSVVVGLVVVEREDDFLVHLVVDVEDPFRRGFQSVARGLHRLVERGPGFGMLAEREVYLRQQRIGRDTGHTGLFGVTGVGQQACGLGKVFGQQAVHLLLGAARDEFGRSRGDDRAGDRNHAECAVEVEIPPGAHEEAFAAVFVVIGNLHAVHVIEYVVAAVDAVVPGIPDVVQNAVARRLDEIVYVVAVLRRDGHRFENILVAAVADLREVETHHCLELGVAGDDALVEIIVGFVEVAFGDVVAGVLFEEAFAART